MDSCQTATNTDDFTGLLNKCATAETAFCAWYGRSRKHSAPPWTVTGCIVRVRYQWDRLLVSANQRDVWIQTTCNECEQYIRSGLVQGYKNRNQSNRRPLAVMSERSCDKCVTWNGNPDSPQINVFHQRLPESYVIKDLEIWRKIVLFIRHIGVQIQKIDCEFATR